MLNFFQKKENKYLIATAIAILFHAVGFIGIVFFDESFFVKTTVYNLLLMFILLLWTQSKKNLHFYFFVLICIIVGIGVEIIGVNTGLLFGKYSYGEVLGFKIKSVPIIIGINWFIIIYCIGITINSLYVKVSQKANELTSVKLKAMSLIVDGASLAVFFDWIMEPVANDLGFWQWHTSNGIPFFNYVCWFIVSTILLLFFHYSKYSKHNKFAVNLLLIQLMFFLLLRTFH